MRGHFYITIVAFFVFAGLASEGYAQASASVSYTIVVSEEMLASGRDNARSGSDQDLLGKGSAEAPNSSVYVKLHSTGTPGMQSPAFEARLSPQQAPEISEILRNGAELAASGEEGAGQSVVRFDEEDGDYLVVMEFN